MSPPALLTRYGVIIFRVVSAPAGLFFVVAVALMASGVRRQCRCRSTLSSHSPPRDRRAFATAADGQQSGATSNSPTMSKFDGTHEKTGGLMPACTQPGCTGRIIDGYCDVCGGPVGCSIFPSCRISGF